MPSKLTSRKFWLATAAGLASIGGSIAGLATQNDVITAVGIGCTVASAAIYAAAEAYVDGKSVASSTSSVNTNITAATSGTASKTVVDSVFAEQPKQAANADGASNE